jgi:polysaccharide export outer membrane protein
MFQGFSQRRVVLFLCACGSLALGQAPVLAPAAPGVDYRIGAGDEISIHITDAEEVKDAFANSFLTDSDGFVTIPMIGRVHAAGLTTSELQTQVREGLKKYMVDPQVFVNIKSVKSQSVSILGAVSTPGVHQVSGPKTLMEVLALAGGLSKEAGYKVDISRQRKWGMIPLPGATWDPTGEFSTAEVNTKRLTDDKTPVDNILIKPNDVITVPRAEVVYVIGEVKKPGGFTLGDRKEVSILEALSLAEGTTATAAPSRAQILRSTPGSTARVRVNIDLKKVLQGKSDEVDLAASDILFIPDNARKRIATKAAETALSTISGLIIWRGL